jgi:hypothetical protein
MTEKTALQLGLEQIRTERKDIRFSLKQFLFGEWVQHWDPDQRDVSSFIYNFNWWISDNIFKYLWESLYIVNFWDDVDYSSYDPMYMFHSSILYREVTAHRSDIFEIIYLTDEDACEKYWLDEEDTNLEDKILDNKADELLDDIEGAIKSMILLEKKLQEAWL